MIVERREAARQARLPKPEDLPTKEDVQKMGQLADKIAWETRAEINDRAAKMPGTPRERMRWIIAQYEEAAKHPDPNNPPITAKMSNELGLLEGKLTTEQKVQYGYRIAKEAPEFGNWTQYRKIEFRVDLVKRMLAEAQKKPNPSSASAPAPK